MPSTLDLFTTDEQTELGRMCCTQSYLFLHPAGSVWCLHTFISGCLKFFFIIINMFQYICTIYAYIAIYVYFLSIWYNIIIIIMSIILPFVLLLLHSLPHHGDIEGNKKNQMYCILSYILIQTLRIWNENPIFLVLSGWNQLELPKGTCRKIEGEIWFAACNVAVWFHLELGAGQN